MIYEFSRNVSINIAEFLDDHEEEPLVDSVLETFESKWDYNHYIEINIFYIFLKF